MSRRYLFGPVSPAFAEQNLARQRQAGSCLPFSPEGQDDLAIGPKDTWAQVCARLPPGWQPDLLILYLPYTHIPHCLWSAPVPIVGLAQDWPLLWQYFRRRLRSCDLVLTDPVGVEALKREGILQARAANLYGCERAFLDLLPSAPATPEIQDGQRRDLDVLFIGNLNPAVQRERLPFLLRLARLAPRWRVAIRTGVFGEAYRRLLNRARIVVDQLSRPRHSRRAFEAVAAGALLFEDAANTDMATCFRDRQECVLYTQENLEALLEYYLEHEDQRRRLVAAAQSRVPQFSFETLWDGLVEQIEREWPALPERARSRPILGQWDSLQVRCSQALNAPFRADPTLVRDLDAALKAEPNAPALHNALGLALTRLYNNPEPARAVAEVAAEHFERAVVSSPTHLVARLNLAEALETAGNHEAALEQARQALAQLERLPELDSASLDAGLFSTDFGVLRVEWERAAWSNPGCPQAEAHAKRALLRWRLHALLAKLTGDLVHYYEALLSRPDLPSCPAALGCTLASKNYSVPALAPLRRALAENPGDRDAARAYFHVLGVTGDRDGQRRLVEDRRLLSRAAPQIVPAEPWFSEPPPPPHDLASLLILCCNELDYTRQCLESVLQRTRPPYELILVDNGSSDGTPAYLEEVRNRPGPVRVEVVRNETNLGFPAGCNQALARARGRYLVFLNNDTVVTTGWLEGLIAWSLHEWPTVGLAGAVTNCAPDAQGVPCGYASLDGLEAFAARRRRDFAGRVLPVPRLTGFCLLVRREVLERTGGFDERYGLGFFDDDDLCLRARDEGYRLLVAQDVYVHHFGSRTFKGLKINTRDQLQKNFDLFKAKWGTEHAAGYRLIGPPTDKAAPTEEQKPTAQPQGDSFPPQSDAVPGESAAPVPEKTPETAAPPEPADLVPPIFSTTSVTLPEVIPASAAKRPLVSLCMIVKNEEKHLPGCLASAADLFEEIVIVDTGSTDRTKEIAANFGARLADFPWVDHFGAARNECLRYATGRWIMWLDADDRLDSDNRPRVQNLFASLGEEMAAYAMKVRSALDATGNSSRLLDQVRMFPNHPQIRWEYRVHEQTLPAVNRLGGQVRWTDVIIDHVGYQDASQRRAKLERNLRLLVLDDAERPDDPFTLFNLGWTLMDLGKTGEALTKMQRSLERSAPDSSIVRKLYHLLTVAHRQQGQKEQARTIGREGLKRFPDDAELLLEEAFMLLEAKDFLRAEVNLLLLLEGQPGPYFGSMDDGVRGYRTRHLLAGHYLEQERSSEAEVQLRAAVLERPVFLPAWLSLGELYLRQGRWPALERVASHLEKEAGAQVEAAVFRARGHKARQDFPAARRILEEILPQAPQALGPRVLLSHILLQEGRDPMAAEAALREVLALNPADGEARHNLTVLLRQQGRLLENGQSVK
jgi:GT2 family glycosyltransferase/Tfp pilus assembly protein PilF